MILLVIAYRFDTQEDTQPQYSVWLYLHFVVLVRVISFCTAK